MSFFHPHTQQPITILATDLDGTLLDSLGEIPDQTLEFLKNLQHQGLKIVLASGRMLPRILPYAERIGGDITLISYNGAKTHERNKRGVIELVRHFSLPYSLCLEVIKYCAQSKLFLNYYCDDVLYGYHVSQEFSAADFYSQQTLAVYERLFSNIEEAPEHAATKLLIVTTPEKRESLYLQLRQQFGDQCAIVKSNPEYLEFVPLGISKGVALKQWAHDHNYDPSSIIAFGDAENDLEMLQAAGFGIAVKNATPGLKEIFTYISEYSNVENVIPKEFSKLSKVL